MNYDIKELIKGEVTFEFYRDHNLYYRTGNGQLLFPVPIDDIGNATFKAKDKGMLFMRYIRKFIAVMDKEREPVLSEEK